MLPDFGVVTHGVVPCGDLWCGHLNAVDLKTGLLFLRKS